MTIERAISGTVYTQLVTTTSILAKLVVCAILLASIANAQAASDQAASDQAASDQAANGDGSNRSGVSRRSDVHATQELAGTRSRPVRSDAHSHLSKLEREWRRLHSDQLIAMRRRLVACSERGECDGLKLASQ